MLEGFVYGLVLLTKIPFVETEVRPALFLYIYFVRRPA